MAWASSVAMSLTVGLPLRFLPRSSSALAASAERPSIRCRQRCLPRRSAHERTHLKRLPVSVEQIGHLSQLSGTESQPRAFERRHLDSRTNAWVRVNAEVGSGPAATTRPKDRAEQSPCRREPDEHLGLHLLSLFRESG